MQQAAEAQYRSPQPRALAGPVLHWLALAVVALVLTAFALLLVTGHPQWDGPVVLPLTEQHGVHRGDVLVALGWLVAIAALGHLAVRSAPRSSGRR